MRKRLLLITNGFPYGNSERSFLLTEYNDLLKEFDVHTLALSWQPILDEQVDIMNAQWLLLERPSVVDALLQAGKPAVIREMWSARQLCGRNAYLKRLKAIAAYSARTALIEEKVAELCEANAIDIIYTYWCTYATLASVRLKKRFPNIKIITRFHGYDLYDERTPENWQPFQNEIAKGCDKLCFVCESGMRYFLHRWGQVWEKKSFVSYLGCRRMTRVNRNNLQRLSLVSCSNMIPLKRIDYIIKALATLPPEIQVDWHHFGDGPERARLEKMAETALGKRENLSYHFWGQVDHAKLNQIYQDIGAQLFITTSSTEGVPVTIQEALGMGIPAIGTAVGGIPELVIDNRTGYLLPADPTVEQVAHAIISYWRASKEEKKKMSDLAYACWYSVCDAEKNAQRFIRILKTIE